MAAAVVIAALASTTGITAGMKNAMRDIVEKVIAAVKGAGKSTMNVRLL